MNDLSVSESVNNVVTVHHLILITSRQSTGKIIDYLLFQLFTQNTTLLIDYAYDVCAYFLVLVNHKCSS